MCIAYSQCQTLSSEDCEDCLSGQAQCELPKPQCGLKGMCNGALIEVVNNSTANTVTPKNVIKEFFFASEFELYFSNYSLQVEIFLF